VTGILEDLPLQSHLDFDFLASYKSLPSLVGDWFMTNHWDSPTWNYVLLEAGASLEEVEGLLSATTQKHVDRASFSQVDHHLLALTDVYFDSPGPMPGPRGDTSFLDILSVIALFILLIACFNFMNLSTSRSGARSGEIGLRKVVGARRGQLVSQFIGESLLHSLLGLVLALGLVQIFLPAFNAFVGKPLAIRYLADLPFQSRQGHRLDRLLHRADSDVRGALRLSRTGQRQAGNYPLQRDRVSVRGLNRAADRRGVSVGHGSEISATR